ncbi:hypothetical protein [Francisella sp. SYW-9]|uniref:hypothetical protein n=1 Tax=Francisella sp. SYW-9 TaxID=2610888 RepID=UPI00123CEB44|nr:hypothetical protein [Francisella sp. SYW-9]
MKTFIEKLILPIIVSSIVAYFTACYTSNLSIKNHIKDIKTKYYLNEFKNLTKYSSINLPATFFKNTKKDIISKNKQNIKERFLINEFSFPDILLSYNKAMLAGIILPRKQFEFLYKCQFQINSLSIKYLDLGIILLNNNIHISKKISELSQFEKNYNTNLNKYEQCYLKLANLSRSFRNKVFEERYNQ